ncbi:MAG: electron transfer flavoprotein subunit alpha [Actinobacteria bacterium QS_8_72_14]|nr:MAG: electron transfer flavoprotein subunit alpha [Actinobacteria bacterium QS_8_72_14]
MEILVCVKRAPAPGAKIPLTADGSAIDTRNLGFTMSPHEECAVEEAVRLVEAHGGSATVMTLGPPEAAEQMRDGIATGADHGVLVETDRTDWDPQATAAALGEAIAQLQQEGARFDLVLFGNESADAAHEQVSVRVAHRLGLPIVNGIKGLETSDGHVALRRDTAAGSERYEVPLPAAVAVKKGLNLPRYPALKGRMRARKATVRTIAALHHPGGLTSHGLRYPPDETTETEILGRGADAAPRVVELLGEEGLT